MSNDDVNNSEQSGASIPSDAELIAMANDARNHAYAPYSKYHVGCALVSSGRVFTGANVENASHGLAICAERSAISAAVFAGCRDLEVVVVATQSSPPASPCGMCRQTMAEFCPDFDKLRILLVNPAGESVEYTLAELLPHAFRNDDLST